MIILCAGPSIQQLSDKIEGLRNTKEEFLLINGHSTVYENTLKKIERYPDYVCSYCDSYTALDNALLKEFQDNETKFLTIDHVYSVSFRARIKTYIDIDPDVDRYDPGKQTNSLIKMLVYFGSQGIKDFYLFGCDGYAGTGSTHYKLHKENDIDARFRDTDSINKRTIGILEDYKLDLNIINCNENSHINCFDKVTVDEGIKMIKKEKEL